MPSPRHKRGVPIPSRRQQSDRHPAWAFRQFLHRVGNDALVFLGVGVGGAAAVDKRDLGARRPRPPHRYRELRDIQ